ncbi:50S ribosomal protein L3 organellar chromatophore [Bienertia sinuspersici]
MEDVQPEIEYWESSTVAYVLGANPPIPVMEGFIRRIWSKYGVDKVIVLQRGMYLIRIKTMEQRDNIVKYERPFFDSKPVVMKAWVDDMDFTKDIVTTIPIWVNITVDFKYWGIRAFEKIVKLVENIIKLDDMTTKRDRLNYARALVEVNIDQYFPDHIDFINERGITTTATINYDWKPINSTKCQKLGHHEVNCHDKVENKNKQQEWRRKETQQVTQKDKSQTQGGYNKGANRKGGPLLTPWIASSVGMQCLDDCGLIDIPYGAHAIFLSEGPSDHCPALIKGSDNNGGGKKPFKYFRMWAQAQDYEKRVDEAWNWKGGGTDMYVLTRKLKQVKSSMKDLNKKGFCATQAEANMAHQDLFRIKSIKKRKLQNTVYVIKNQDGQMVDTPETVAQAFQNYYLRLLGERKDNRE